MPPPDFKVLSAAEVAETKQKQFETDNPQLALWLRIKGRLLEDDGVSYFESDMKGAALPALKGRVIEAKPACRPKELLIAIEGSTAEVSLKLDKALNGKPQLPAELQWQGEAEAFTKSPFLVSARAEAGSVQGLTLTPCSVTPRK